MAEQRIVRTVIPLLRRDLILASLKRGERLDGRGLQDVRQFTVRTNYVSKAEGSALVELGKTKVIAGVKTSLVNPFMDTPDQGVLIVNAELSPLASPFFEAGPPGEEDIELARVIDRGLRSAPAIDFGKLAIIPGVKVWGIYVDIYPLDYDGNLIDASGIAAMAALLSAKLPKVKVEDNRVSLLEEYERMPIVRRVAYVSIVKIGNHLVVDPTLEEEFVSDARITFAITEDGNICAIQKGGAGSFTVKELLDAQETAFQAAERIFSVLRSL
ncbi:MAG: exosome complex protein Rrp42 [Thermofilum sp.]